MKAMFACTHNETSDGEAKLLSSSDVQSISTRNKAICLQANNIMSQCRDLVRDCEIGMDDSRVLILFSELDINLVRFVHGKTSTSQKNTSPSQQLHLCSGNRSTTSHPRWANRWDSAHGLSDRKTKPAARRKLIAVALHQCSFAMHRLVPLEQTT